MKMIFYSLLLLCMVFVFSTSHTNAKNKKSALIGEWVYEVSDAPEEYKTGSLIFSEKEGEIVCVIKLEAGELATSDLKIENEKVTFTTYIDGSPINVILTKDKDKLNGTVDSPEGLKEITALKKQ